MKNTLSIFFFSFFTIAFYSPVKAQTAPTYIADSLQSILDASLPTTFSNPGAVMGIVVPGQWSWYSASGNAIAGITAGQPLTNANDSTLFRAGSITKNMIATCILKLDGLGLLSIDDPIHLYLRSTLVIDTLASSDTVLIRHLLNHTSGIANSADNAACQSLVLTNPLAAHSLEESIYCGASLGELFTPGTSWSYSNTNYTLLAMIIQNVTGQSAATYIQNNIITPLALTHTQIPDSNQIQTQHMGCYWNLGSWVDLTIINPTTYTGWADMVSNTHDLTNYYNALLNGDIIDSVQLTKMKTIDAAAYGYGMGTDFYTISGIDYYGHYGEVANTSGMFYANTSSAIAPNGYYIAYNFNTQGVDMQGKIDVPVFQLLNSNWNSVNETQVQNNFGVYPNPATLTCQLRFTLPINNGKMIVRDVQGRILFSQNLPDGTTHYTLDLREYQKGIYFISINDAKNNNTQQLIKE